MTMNASAEAPPFAMFNDSSCESDDSDEENYYFYEDIGKLKASWIHEPHFVPLVIVYGTVFLFGIIGNSVVIFSILGSRSTRSVTFTFMVSLALADILFLMVVVPHETLRMVLGEWPGGQAYCKISGFTEMLTAVASVLNLTAVSFERYFVIVMPMQSRRRCTVGNTRKILVAVWIISIFISSPALYVRDIQQTTYHNNDTSVTLVFCSDHGVRDRQRLYFAIYQLMVMFVIPTGCMTFCYSGVIHVLWISQRTLVRLTSTMQSLDLSGSSGSSIESTPAQSRHRKFVFRRNHPSSNKNIRESIIKGRKQVIKMLITVILVFLVCWGPQLIFRTLKYSDYGVYIYTETHFKLQIALYCLPYIQSCLNPVIYGFMSKSFRESFKTSCSRHILMSHCKSRRSPLAELELEYYNGSVLTRALRPSASSEWNNY